MFPSLRVSFLNAETASNSLVGPAKFEVLVDVIPVDRRRYRYAYHKSSWLVAGKADPPSKPCLYRHPDGPFTVDQLAKAPVSFEKLKLTNNEMDTTSSVIILNSMHKYQPRIHLLRWTSPAAFDLKRTNLETAELKTYVFKETQFMAVTAYQNQLVTKKKIDNNPFAKGFRDSSRLSDYDRDYGEQPMFMGHRAPYIVPGPGFGPGAAFGLRPGGPLVVPPAVYQYQQYQIAAVMRQQAMMQQWMAAARAASQAGSSAAENSPVPTNHSGSSQPSPLLPPSEPPTSPAVAPTPKEVPSIRSTSPLSQYRTCTN